MKTKLAYGMKLIIPVTIEYVVREMPISSSCSRIIETEIEFEIFKYWDDDTDPMRYKVNCVPTNKQSLIGDESFYSRDLVRLIEAGRIKVVTDK